jgi:hypothetical protein
MLMGDVLYKREEEGYSYTERDMHRQTDMHAHKQKFTKTLT